MEAVCSKSTVPVVHCSFAGLRQSNSVNTSYVECGLGGALIRQPLQCKPRTYLSHRTNKIKRGGQLWGLELRSEATDGNEDSIPGKKNPHSAKKCREVVATGVHRGNLNGYSTAEDADSGEKLHADVTNEVRHALTSDASCAVVNSRNGSANGNSVKRAVRNGSANGNGFKSSPTLNGSTNGTIANGASIYAGQEKPVNSVNGIYRNGRPHNAVAVNGAVNGYAKAPIADGATSVVPELERLVQAPLSVPTKQTDVEALMELLHQLEDPLAFTTTAMTTLHSATAVVDGIGWDTAREQSSASDTASGLGIINFLKGKKLLVTGATGFLAKGNYSTILLSFRPD